MIGNPLSKTAGGPSLTARLLYPSTLFLIASNMVPLVGVLYWHWDLFSLLVLYWIDTAIIGFWMIARIITSPPGMLGTLLVNGRPTTASPLAMAGFFLVHGGGFMGVHMLFLWAMFSGDWSGKIHGVSDFVAQLIIGTGAWIPVLAFFISRGLSFLFHDLRPDLMQRIERMLSLAPAPLPAAGTGDRSSKIVGEFYVRVFVMHASIIFSAFLALIFGSIAPLLVMIALKTLVDVTLHIAMSFDQPFKHGSAAQTSA